MIITVFVYLYIHLCTSHTYIYIHIHTHIYVYTKQVMHITIACHQPSDSQPVPKEWLPTPMGTIFQGFFSMMSYGWDSQLRLAVLVLFPPKSLCPLSLCHHQGSLRSSDILGCVQHCKNY